LIVRAQLRQKMLRLPRQLDHLAKVQHRLVALGASGEVIHSALHISFRSSGMKDKLAIFSRHPL
jgi:hypothetical protein